MGFKRTVEPTETPVTLAEAKAQCRVLDDDEDTLITGLIAAASAMVEEYIGRSLTQQTWRLTLDAFADRIILPRGPVRSVSAFTVLPATGAAETVSADIYTLDTESDPCAIVRNPLATWPTPGERVNPVAITYVAGYASVPGPIKLAILHLISGWFDNRAALLTGTIVAEMPFSTMALLENYRAHA